MSLAITELEFLWRAVGLYGVDKDSLVDKCVVTDPASQNIHQWGEMLIKLASHTYDTSLLRLTPIRHYLSSMDMDGGIRNSATFSAVTYRVTAIISPIIFATIHQWLTVICDVDPPKSYEVCCRFYWYIPC